MSFGDIYTAPPGSPVAGNAPGLPPVDLPKEPARQPLRITVGGRKEPEAGSWIQTAPDWQPPKETRKEEHAGKAWAESTEDWKPSPPPREIGTGEAIGRGFADTATYGLAPALQGALQAGQRADEAEGAFSELKNVIRGLHNLIQGDPETVQAYQKARDEERAANEQAFEQHPIAYGGGALAGGLASPTPIKLGPATFLGRMARGAVAGGVSGGLYGAGSAVSKGEDLNQALHEIGGSAVTGAGLGAALHGAIGPRVRPAVSPGQAAARTAEGLGTPLPRGLASDNPAIQATTSKLRQFPVVGPRISKAVENVQEAAGSRIGEIAQGGRGVTPNRSLAGATLRPALRDYQETNKATIGRAYDLLKRVSNTHLFAPRVATGKAVETILRRRRGARLANPEAGLEDVLNLLYGGKGGTFGGGISFRGLQEARSLLGEKLKFPEQHPGFKVGEGRLLYAAMSQDMEHAVRRHATINPDEAARYLKQAHQVAKEMIERNTAAQRVLNISNDESLVGALINAAQERTGNLNILRNLRSTMPPQDFEHISGVLLSELGHNPSTGEFSLAKFVTGWDKLSNDAKQELFSPQHLQELENIFGMGKHIKGALKESNTSHTAGVLILLDVAKDAALLAADLASGGLGAGSAVGAGTTGIMTALATWLGNPAKTASISKWVTAYRALTLNAPTPARRAVFNIATRNLANTLGVPAEAILQRAAQAALPRQTAVSPAKNQSRAQPQSLGR